MSLLAESARWLTDPANYRGTQGIAVRLGEHVQISVLSVALSALIAIPIGVAIGHTRRGRFLVTSVANFGRAVPSFAILAIALPLTIRLGLGLGFWPTVVALVFLGIPPILTNTYIGVEGVDARIVEAARGMGMKERQVLGSIEIPLAAPLIVAGLRTAAVQVVATATLAALVAWGGLGRFIIDGFAVQDRVMILGGAVLVASLAILVELSLGSIQRLTAARTRSRVAAP